MSLEAECLTYTLNYLQCISGACFKVIGMALVTNVERQHLIGISADLAETATIMVAQRSSSTDDLWVSLSWESG